MSGAVSTGVSAAAATTAAASAAAVRRVARLITAHKQEEGAGFIVRRPFPSAGMPQFDPFLLLDEMGPIEYGPGEAKGAPDHPHRGFETVSYILDGELEHEDSAGHHGVLGAGDVQWMTAGDGVVHSEMPSRRMQREGGRMHGFQVWVNLPRRDKRMAPRYQEIPRDRIPEAATPDGKARVRVIAGEALGAKAVIETRTPIVYQDWTLQPGADVTVAVPADHQAMLYVFGGAAQVGDGDEATVAKDGQAALLGEGDAVRLRGVWPKGPTRALLLAGVPLREPMARYGPFVMNTDAEIREAFVDYQLGRLGSIRRDGAA